MLGAGKAKEKGLRKYELARKIQATKYEFALAPKSLSTRRKAKSTSINIMSSLTILRIFLDTFL